MSFQKFVFSVGVSAILLQTSAVPKLIVTCFMVAFLWYISTKS